MSLTRFGRIGRFGRSVLAGLAAGIFGAALLVVPATTLAANPPKIETTLGVANNSTSDKGYKASVDAVQGQMVQIQLYYVNKEAANSGKIAQTVHVKIALPTEAGKSQTVKSTLQTEGDGAMDDEVTVNTDHDDSTLQYIPGTAVWKHNTSSAEAPGFVETKLPDDVVMADRGLVIEDQQPGDAFGSTVSIKARVGGSGVKVTAQTQLKGQTNTWSSSNTAKPGETMRMLIGYQNTAIQPQNGVSVRAALTKDATLNAGTTTITNAVQPNGAPANSDEVAGKGLNIGNYKAGANAFVAFDFTLPSADKLTCGMNRLQNSGVVELANGSEYYATALTRVNRECQEGARLTPVAPAETDNKAIKLQDQPAAAYSCDKLTITKLAGHKAEFHVDYTARNGASLKMITYNFGDNTTPLSTDKATVQHDYAADGNYPVIVTLKMSVNGADKSVNGPECVKSVSFAPAATAPAGTNKPTSPSALPNSGPSNVIAVFVITAIAGTAAHRIYLNRRMRRYRYDFDW